VGHTCEQVVCLCCRLGADSVLFRMRLPQGKIEKSGGDGHVSAHAHTDAHHPLDLASRWEREKRVGHREPKISLHFSFAHPTQTYVGETGNAYCHQSGGTDR
jgi:hypothetical protein